LLVGYEISLG
jgi:hypothetical protein